MSLPFASAKSRQKKMRQVIATGVLLALLTSNSLAHPIPDVPVWSFFHADGSARIKIEIDVRCFSDDPENEPYLQYRVLKEMTEEERADLLKQAAEYVKNTVAFRFEPAGFVEPKFVFAFEKLGQGKLEKTNDPVVISGEWASSLAENTTGYGIDALPAGELSVLFLNHINDEAVPRIQVLFPKEKSYLLDLTELRRMPPAR